MTDCFWDCAKALAALEQDDVAAAKRILAEALNREAPPIQEPQTTAA